MNKPCKRCKGTCPALDPDWEGHGKYSNYSAHSCRCDACREDNRRYVAEWRQRNARPGRTRSAAAQEREDALGADGRAARALRGWETRRRNASERLAS